jgi:acid phosphatase family membrane protein YuiD
MITLIDIITNEFLIGAIITIALAQGIKAITNSIKGNKFSFKHLVYGVGGMPSSHSAAVSYLASSVFILEGLSNLFVISLVFSIIIIRDAVGVRHIVGEQGKVINKLEEKEFKKQSSIVHFSGKVGHTPVQAFAGIILGIAVALVMHLF